MRTQIPHRLVRIGIILLAFGLSLTSQAASPVTTIDLWPQTYLEDGRSKPMPQEQQNAGGFITHVAIPRMVVYKPAHSNHKAILVMSGGGYEVEAVGNEGTPVSEWLADQGYTVFNLIYRLPNDNWSNKLVPLADGQRALRIIRQKAKDYDYSQVGVMGFSAGGHIAGMLAVSPNWNFYEPQDAADNYSARPDFAALLYPLVSMVGPGRTASFYRILLDKDANPFQKRLLSIEQLVSQDTPPMFIACAKDDPVVPVYDSIALDEALKKQGIKESLTLFNNGGHGWGLGQPGTETAKWPALFKKWADTLGH